MLFKHVFQKIRGQNPSNPSEFMLSYLVFVGIFNNLSIQFFITSSIALPAKSVLGKFLNANILDGMTNHVWFPPFGQ